MSGEQSTHEGRDMTELEAHRRWHADHLSATREATLRGDHQWAAVRLELAAVTRQMIISAKRAG